MPPAVIAAGCHGRRVGLVGDPAGEVLDVANDLRREVLTPFAVDAAKSAPGSAGKECGAADMDGAAVTLPAGAVGGISGV